MRSAIFQSLLESSEGTLEIVAKSCPSRLADDLHCILLASLNDQGVFDGMKMNSKSVLLGTVAETQELSQTVAVHQDIDAVKSVFRILYFQCPEDGLEWLVWNLCTVLVYELSPSLA